jgi:CheY-like chemotaxis protein
LQLIELKGGNVGVKNNVTKGNKQSLSSQFSQEKKNSSLNSILKNNKTELNSLNTDSLKGTKILLVEDNLINQDVAVAMLTQKNIVTKVAENGKQALEMLDQEDFDCVLMDIQMPIMDGYTATREIRKKTRFKNLPILAMTANALVSDEKLSLEAGMNCHISKPIDVECLFRELLRWINFGGNIPSQEIENDFIAEPTLLIEDEANLTLLDVAGALVLNVNYIVRFATIILSGFIIVCFPYFS